MSSSLCDLKNVLTVTLQKNITAYEIPDLWVIRFDLGLSWLMSKENSCNGETFWCSVSVYILFISTVAAYAKDLLSLPYILEMHNIMEVMILFLITFKKLITYCETGDS